MISTDPAGLSTSMEEFRESKDKLCEELKKRRHEEDLFPPDQARHGVSNDSDDENRLLKLINSTIRHNIYNQVHIITGYSALLVEMTKDQQEMQELLQIILGAASGIQRQISYTHDYQDIKCRKSGWVPLETAVKNAISAAPVSGIAFNMEIRNVEVYTVPLIESVFLNILDNSVRHGGRVKNIDIWFEDKETKGIIFIQDDGIGIADDLKEKIFERGIGTDSGLGLFLAGEVLSATGLSIRENGTEGEGARFMIDVPKCCYRITG